MIGTTVLAFLAGLITSLADGDAFSLSLGTGLLILTVILLAVRILRLYQKSLFTEEAHFLMTLPMPAKDLLRGRLAVGIMWMSMAEIAYCSPILLSLLYNEADAFEQDKMQVIIYWMMERESSTVDITVGIADDCWHSCNGGAAGACLCDTARERQFSLWNALRCGGGRSRHDGASVQALQGIAGNRA